MSNSNAPLFAVVDDASRAAVLKGVETLTRIDHVDYMSRSMLVTASGIKDTKLRATLQELINEKRLQQVRVTQTRRPRYFYVITPEGKQFLSDFADRAPETKDEV